MAGTANTLVTDKEKIRQLRRRVQHAMKKHQFSQGQIARNCGLNRSTMNRIMGKKLPKHMYKKTYDAIYDYLDTLLVRADPVATREVRTKGRVSKELTKLAIEGLMVRGWPRRWVAEQLQVGKSTVTEILHDEKLKGVSIEVEQRAVELAKKYGTTDGPDKRTRLFAERRGYQSTVMQDEFL
jgi:predicted XRE-type DNA-binding protein